MQVEQGKTEAARKVHRTRLAEEWGAGWHAMQEGEAIGRQGKIEGSAAMAAGRL